jgi:hypothetical protein
MLKPYIEIKNVRGVDNKTDSYRVQGKNVKWLKQAENVDIDSTGAVKMCDGYTELLTGSYRSLWASPDEAVCLALKGTDLVRIYNDYSEAVLLSNVDPIRRMSCDYVNGMSVVTNGEFIGHVTENVFSSFASVTANETKQHLIDHYTATRMNPPAGQLLCIYKNVLYVARGNVVYYSDPMAFHRVKRKQGFLQFEGFVTMLAPVDDGIWVSDGKTHFLSGSGPKDFTTTPNAKTTITTYDSVMYSLAPNRVDSEYIALEGLRGTARMWMSKKGICVGGNSGFFVNMTEKHYEMPSNKYGAGIFKESTDRKHYIGVVES